MNKYIKYILTLTFLLTLVFISCDKDNINISDINALMSKDTLVRELKSGIFLSANSLKDIYSLDESLIATVKIINEYNDDGLPIFIGSYPPFLYWSVYDEKDNLISFGPKIVGDMVYRDTLNLSESLFENIKWDQSISDNYTMFNDLKAYSGKYKLILRFSGIDRSLKPYLIKYFEINEIGEPLSIYLFRNFEPKDSIKYDLILRNRTLTEIQLTVSGDSSYLYLYKYGKSEPTFVLPISLEKQNYILSAHSDSIFYKFRYSKNDLLNKGLEGECEIIVRLNFKERIIVQRKVFSIFR